MLPIGLQTFVNGNIPVVAYNANKINKPDRIRFTLLHELAHLLLEFGDVTERKKETLCHQFAGAMLLPEETIKAITRICRFQFRPGSDE